MFLLRFVCLLLISLLLGVAQEKFQPPTRHPELIAGPWELASDSGIDGIFLNIVTSSDGPNGHEQIAWQTIDIRVYHRQAGKETWGYFGTKDKAAPASYSMQDGHSFTLFDGERLRIHFSDVTDLQPFDLDIIFSPATHSWMGTWSRFGQNFDVVLKRPDLSGGDTPSAFVGDWLGGSAPNSPSNFAPGSLHISQSRDDTLSAWLDRTISDVDPKTRWVHNDQRNGERLQVKSVTDSGLILETSSAIRSPLSIPREPLRRSSSTHRQLGAGVGWSSECARWVSKGPLVKQLNDGM